MIRNVELDRKLAKITCHYLRIYKEICHLFSHLAPMKEMMKIDILTVSLTYFFRNHMRVQQSSPDAGEGWLSQVRLSYCGSQYSELEAISRDPY